MIGILGGMGTQAGLDFCNKLAAFPTIKLPDQNNIAKNRNKYAILFLLNTKFLSKPL